MAFVGSHLDATSRSCEPSSHYTQQDPYMFPSASPNAYDVATDFPQIPDVLSYPPFWCHGFSGYRGNSYGADAPINLGTPIQHTQYCDSLFQPRPTEQFMTGCLQQRTEMPQLQQMRYEEPSHGDQGEPAPVDQSQMLLSSLCGCHSLTPITVTQNNDISLSGFHGPLHHPSLIQWRGVTSDVSRIATPMSMHSSYSNSSGYANTVQSSQSNASVPAASFSSPLLHVPDGISQYEHNRQKNRAATARCREKTQQYTQELREKERDLLSKKQSLKACIADLQDEVLALKSEILQHSHCDCDHIQRYLRAAASQVA